MSSRLAQRRTFDHKAEPASPSHELVHFLLLPQSRGFHDHPQQGLGDSQTTSILHSAPTDMPTLLARQRSWGPLSHPAVPDSL